MGDGNGLLNRAAAVLGRRTPLLSSKSLNNYVQSFLNNKDQFLKAAVKYGSPLYLIDLQVLLERASQFMKAFDAYLPDFQAFYAVKSNNHPVVAENVVKSGYGLDVSSGLELKAAVSAGAENIIFSGPGKTGSELSLSVVHHDRVTVLLDSLGELERLEKVAADHNKSITVGIRLTTNEEGLWRKFGIPIRALPEIMAAAEKSKYVRLQGIQFHSSWNLDPSAQCRFIERLGKALCDLPPKWRNRIEFIDIGGGYWPSQGEWLQPAGTPEGRLRQNILDHHEMPMTHHCLPAAGIDEFAGSISETLRKSVFGGLKCRIYAEPGRWLVNDAMHILLTVVDCKDNDIVITDGGTNLIGWERFESDYAPIINLSQGKLDEHACYVFGSLCTPHDIWGYSYHGSGITVGDILLVPGQGAYTYSLRQNFIKPIADVVIMNNGNLEQAGNIGE